MPLAGGAFQCLLSKIRAIKQDDELFDENRNNYVSKFDAGAGYLSYMSPENSRDVHMAYFEQYGLYQTPLHFPIPASEYQTDATLSKLIFQSIGAHRVEPIENGRLVNLNPIS